MRGLMPTGTVARTVPKPTASTGLLGSQLGLVGQSGRGAERNADDADRACVDAVACVGDDHLVAGWGEVCPERRLADGDGVGGCRGHDVEQVGLSVDDADGAVGLVHDEGALGVGGHDAVDGTTAHGDGIGIDGVAGGLDGGDLTGAAADALADGVDARGAGDADDVDRREGRVDGEFLLQVEGLTDELGDGVQAGVGDVGVGALGKDADRVGAGEKRGLQDLALQELRC